MTVAGATRILIDGYHWRKPRGFGRYLREAVHALAKARPDDCQIVVAIPSQPAPAPLGDLTFVSLPSVPLPIWEQVVLPLATKNLNVDVLHAPANTAPLSVGARLVITIHDLNSFDPKVRRGTLYQKCGRIYCRAIMKRALSGEAELVTVSAATQQQVRARFGRNSALVYNSVSHFLDTQADAVDCPRPYLLHVGGVAPTKNSVRCIQSFLRAAPPEWRLVVVGIAATDKFALRLKSERVLFPGWVEDGKLVSLYKGAAGLLFPSLVEGFGLPIIEAFGFGVPVMTSKREPMIEIAGRAALYVDPLNEADLEAAIRQLASEPALRMALSEAGRSRAQLFGSARQACGLLGVYRRAAGRADRATPSNLHQVL